MNQANLMSDGIDGPSKFTDPAVSLAALIGFE
jgi:hypothetical protein